MARTRTPASETPSKEDPSIMESEVLEKTRVGLARDQAIEVIQNQRSHDAALEEAEKKAAARKKA